MSEEYLELFHLYWSDTVIMNGQLVGGKIVNQTLTKSQIGEVDSLQSAHNGEMQRLLRSFVDE